MRFSLLLTALLLLSFRPADGAEARPNILWLTSEDNGPHLGCYGDRYATTPHLDRLAERSLRYLHCWSNAPVCAPARTTIISGVYPTSTGSEHMRSKVRMPAQLRMYPQLLRDAGYYCTNNSKEDYNLIPNGRVWDESSGKAHWRNRQANQPFFAIFNHTISHESQIRNRPHKAVHDPAGVRIPAYHPDTPEVRQDWAQYYDRLTEMDAQVGARLKELQEAGLADDTIVFYYGDHGSGMPRSKRIPLNSGLHVPLLVHIPDRFAHLRPKEYQAGGTSERLISFVDLAPTLLSLIGQKPLDWMQGYAFAGPFDAGPQPFVYGFRGRMDERQDMIRSVHDGRYVYVRHFMPHRPYGQHVSYMFQTPTTAVWKKLFDAGQLNAEQSHFWKEKPTEELFDLQSDPDEVHNLAGSRDHQDVLQKMRTAQRELALRIRDVGYLPEEEIHSRPKDSTAWEMARDPQKYPLERIMDAAELASSRNPDSTPRLRILLADGDSAVRYWAAQGLVMRGAPSVDAAGAELHRALQDDSPSVRIAAAEALGKFGSDSDLEAALPVLLAAANVEQSGIFQAVPALNALDEMGERARPALSVIRKLPRKASNIPPRMGDYAQRLLEKTLADLTADE